MPFYRMSNPQDTEEDRGDLTSFLTGLTGIVGQKKKEKESKKYLDAIRNEISGGKLSQEYEIDADGNVTTKLKSIDKTKVALDKSTIRKNMAEARSKTIGGGLSIEQQLAEKRRENARNALMKMIQNAANNNPELAMKQYGGSGDSHMMDLLTKHGITFEDATKDLGEDTVFGQHRSKTQKRAQAVQELTKAGYPVTEKNIQAALEQLG